MNQVDEQVGALTQTPAPMGSTVRPTDDRPLTRIDGRTTWSWNDVLEIWRFRELFYNLTLRDVKLRYKQTILGVGWSFFQPLATVMVFVLFVGVLGKARGDMGYGEYILYVMAGVIPWTFFASSVQNAGNSLLNNHNLVTKTYFPRLALPSANVFAALFDFGICLVMFAVAIVGFALFGQPVSVGPQLLLLPVVVLLLILLTLGLGVVFSALIAAQRDFRFLITFPVHLPAAWQLQRHHENDPHGEPGVRPHRQLPGVCAGPTAGLAQLRGRRIPEHRHFPVRDGVFPSRGPHPGGYDLVLRRTSSCRGFACSWAWGSCWLSVCRWVCRHRCQRRNSASRSSS
jgi:lipopolysaccharide transport system permease protein